MKTEPCPCGSESPYVFYDDCDYTYIVICKECDTYGKISFTKEDAIEKWNDACKLIREESTR